MLDNLIIWGVSCVYMLAVAAIAIACLWGVTKLDGWFQDWMGK